MLTLTNLTKKRKPSISWEVTQKKILGEKYELSVVLCGNQRLRTLNKNYRGKNKIAQTLSFSMSKNEGEIFLNANNTKNRLFFLYIHSLLHLKGYKHGQKMEQMEKKYYNI